MLTIRSQCGQVFQADERFTGRAIKCWKCDEIMLIGEALPMPAGPATASRRSSTRRLVAGALAAVAVLAAIVWIALSPVTYRRETVADSKQERTAPTTVDMLDALDRDSAARSTSSRSAPSESQTHAKKQAVAPPSASKGTASPDSALREAPVLDVSGRLAEERGTTRRERPVPANRLTTGTNIRPASGAAGRGTLTIRNGTTYDAAVTLLDEETTSTRRVVYVRAQDVTTAEAVAPCICRLFFALGTDWDAAAEEFRRDASFAVFDDLLRFTETETDRGVEWATFSVTLHPVPEGKAHTTRLSKDEFDTRLGKHRSRSGV